MTHNILLTKFILDHFFGGRSPYAELPDSAVLTWYRLGTSLSTKPSGDFGEYSKLGVSSFEPRNAHKGHVARAIFYFYTIYKAQSSASFFEGMKETLLKWHYLYPVDSSEYARTIKIAVYQSGKINPFIVDTSLVRRAYAVSTGVTRTDGSVPPACSLEQNFPDPFNPATQIAYQLKDAGIVRLGVYDMLGREVAVLVNERQDAGSYSTTWNAGTLSSGAYIYHISVKDDNGKSRFNETKRMMLIK